MNRNNSSSVMTSLLTASFYIFASITISTSLVTEAKAQTISSQNYPTQYQPAPALQPTQGQPTQFQPGDALLADIQAQNQAAAAAAAAAQQQPTQYPAQYPTNPYQAAPVNYGPSTPPSNPPSNLPPLPSDFELGVQQNLILTPEQIRKLRVMLEANQQAVAEIPNPPKSVTGSISVSLDPGSTPPVVRPFFGVSTSLVVLDSTGAPWPVENFNIGNRFMFSVERLDGPLGSSFVISPLQNFGQSNLILKLAGLSTPVVINLISGQKIHDARVEARVMGRGPNAIITSTQLTPGIDSRLLPVLDGVPPEGRELEVEGDDYSKAWMMPDGRLWLRTNITLTSPAYISLVSASDGTNVYSLMPTAKVLGMINGQYVTLSINGCLQECNNYSSW